MRIKLDPIEQAIIEWAEAQNDGDDSRRHDVHQLVTTRAKLIADAVRGAWVKSVHDTALPPMGWVSLSMDLREAASRTGKARGDHMAAVFATLARAMRSSEQRADLDLAETLDSAAHALRAETAMVEALQAAAIEAAVEIERMQGSLI